jgi:hypothetical protein
MKPRAAILLPAILLASLLAACGGARLPFAASAPGQPGPALAASAAASAQPAGAPNAGTAAQARTATSTTPAQAQAAANPQALAPVPPLPPVSPMVIKNGSLNIQVDDPEGSLSQVDQVVAVEQGTIASQTIRTQDDKTFVNLVIQVPPGNFEDTLAKLRDLRSRGSRVLADTVNTQDVTDQYIDLDAQYRNLQATRDAYQKLLDKATAVQDIITLTREVASIQTQMDQIQGRKNLLSRQSGVATITLTLTPPGAPQPGPRPLPQPAQAASDAWQALLTGLRGLAVVLIWMAVLLPLPALALAGGWLAWRRLGRPAQPGRASS